MATLTTLLTVNSALTGQRAAIETHGNIIDAIFRGGAGLRVTPEVERELVLSAQAGDQDAGEALLLVYAGALANAAARRGSRVSQEDAEGALLAAFWETLATFNVDAGGRLANVLPMPLAHSINDAWAEGLCAEVPYRTARRYFGLVRRAGGDVELAASMAPDYQMSVDTFWAVYYLMRPVGSDAGTDGEGHATLYTVAESDYQLAHIALDSVHGVEHDVTMHAFGFASGEPMSDGEVAEAISERDLSRAEFEGGQRTISRPSVQRARARALDTMRETLAAI